MMLFFICGVRLFRKSVAFFILLALFWVLLWQYIPDQTPGHFSITDLMRGMLLMFSLMAFGFAMLMMIIRYKGVDLASRFIPHAGLVLWLGKHAYQYSQPKTIIYCQASTAMTIRRVTIQTEHNEHVVPLIPGQIQTAVLGHLRNNPVFQWQNDTGETISNELDIKSHLKKLGKNTHVDVVLHNHSLQSSIR